MQNDNIKEKIFEYIASEAESLGYQIVDVQFRSNRPVSVEIIIDKEGGITVGECIQLSKKVGAWIDENDMFPEGHAIDVCSPGIDRILKSDNEFKWAQGKNLEVYVREPVNGKTNFTGVLSVFENENGLMELTQENGDLVAIQKENITKARLKVVL